MVGINRFNWYADSSNNTYLAILTILISGREIYGEGRTSKFSDGGVFKMSSSQFLCHERATIKGVHLQNENHRSQKLRTPLYNDDEWI